MDWEDGRTSGVKDRRGSGGGLGPQHYAGGGSIVLIIVALIGYFVFHIDPRQILNLAETGQVPGASAPANPSDTAITQCPAGDQDCRFADIIHTSANDTWAAIFKAQGKPYHPSKIALYSEATQTGCGDGQAAMGPFYCPEDETVYLDLDFFNTLDKQLGAPGDAAKAYVIAHEVGHHIQKLLGVSDAVSKQQQSLDEAGGNALSVRLELQADCYAGVWAKTSNVQKNWIHPADVEAALNAAAAVGDDTLQKETQGRIVPDSFTHGTSAQRMQWFKAGYDSGQPTACDTFAN